MLVLTGGAYSDYCITEHLITLRDCDFGALGREFSDQGQGKVKFLFSADFAEWLIANGHCAKIDVTEIDTGSYGFELGMNE